MKTKVNKKFVLISIGMALMMMFAPAASAQADTEPPSDVENLKAVAGDSMINLTWNVATDNDVVEGYKVYFGTEPVVEPGQEYETSVDTGNKISYDLEGLENGTTYYMAVTAYDPAGNESENYSVEVSATPAHGAADSEAPTVVQAEALDKYTVLVTFSEPVSVPETDPQSAFTIVDDATGMTLDVLAAALNLEDTSEKSVLLTTAEQQAGANYVLTAGIQVEDKSGNPIQSGTSDTGVFIGTDLEPKEFEPQGDLVAEGEDTVGPQLIDVQVSDNTHVQIAFSEVVNLGPAPELSFIITEEENIQNTLDVYEAVLSPKGDIVTLTTAPQQPKNYNLIVMEDVTDEAGNMIDVANNATVFFGGSAPEEVVEETPEAENPEDMPEETPEDLISDVTPPEDASDLKAKLLENMTGMLTWTPSANTAGDLANYVLYKSTDGTDYGDSVMLDPTAESHDLKGLVSDMTYFFKLTAKDTAGNESDGIKTAFTLELPQTGPELALLLLGSAGLGGLMNRKKKRK